MGVFMKRILILFNLGVLLIFAIACKETSTGPTYKVLLPMSIGNYWIYDTYTLDSMNRRTTDPPGKDSVVITSKVEKLGKEGYTFTTYSLDSLGNYQKGSETIYRTEEGKLYAHSGIITDMLKRFPFELPVQIDEQWLMLVDPDDDFWRIYELEIPETSIPLIQGLTIKGKIEIYGSKENIENITVANNNYNCQGYLIRQYFKGTIKFATYSFPIEFERKSYNWFANDYGLFHTINKSFEIPIPMTTNSMKFEGSDVIINHFNINK